MDWSKLLPWRREEAAPASVVPQREPSKLRSAVYKAQQTPAYKYPIKAPEIALGVVPKGERAPVSIAMDDWGGQFPGASAYAYSAGGIAGFPGYPHLSMLATRAEYRAMASALSTEMVREWITINSSETASDSTKTKVTKLKKAMDDMKIQQIIQRAVEHDAYFGRAQILICLKGHDITTPLVLDKRTITPGTFEKVVTVEAIWTTPATYNALRPQDDDFYKPSKWFMLGQQVHASRLMTVITRPLPDMLKPAFNFGGMSISQLAEPYVDNWLRTRQSVADLINNFSITALATSMDQILTGGDDGTDLFNRADLFTATRSNRGLMMLDKDREELVQVNVPLGGLHELQAQSQEHMCAVSRLPAIILTGISPGGLNASSDGEIRTFYDWIAAQQESYWRSPIDTIFKVLQLSMYGEIDEDITWAFVSLFQMTPAELAAIRLSDSTAAGNYINAGVIAPEEDRERLARDPESGYQGLDLSLTITPPDQGNEDDNEQSKEDE